jgi:deoxyuridine 5'-triphosphate nucleotidohydrolase
MGAHVSVFRDPRAIQPTRSTQNSVGFDLYALNTYPIEPFSRALCDTGVQIILAPGTFGKIENVSYLPLTTGLHVIQGIIDPDYTGTLKAMVVNPTNLFKNIEAGQRIAQLVIHQYSTIPMVSLPLGMRPYTPQDLNIRGNRGFGQIDGENPCGSELVIQSTARNTVIPLRTSRAQQPANQPPAAGEPEPEPINLSNGSTQSSLSGNASDAEV